MKILAIETATEACSAALLVDNVVISRFQVAPREHGNLILPMVDELLTEAGLALTELDALAFGRGPGSFTGVRMATGVIQGLAYAAQLPVAAVSTLHALASQADFTDEIKTVFVALDARMGEVYWAEYAVVDNKLLLIGNEQVIAPDKITSKSDNKALAIGHGWSAYKDILLQQVNGCVEVVCADKLPNAKEVAYLAKRMVEKGQLVTAENALPVYLRDNVAKKKQPKVKQ